MFAFVRAALLAAAVLFQDAEVKKWIGDLDHDEPDVRERAGLRLRQIGEPALDDLMRAGRDADPEVRTRAAAIAQWIQEDITLKARMRFLRPFKFRTVAVDLHDLSLREALKQIGDSCTQFLCTTRLKDLDRNVTLNARNAPLLKVLDDLGLDLSVENQFRTVEPAPEGFQTAFTDGTAFRLKTEAHGKGGTIIHTLCTHEFDGTIEWDVSVLASKRKLPIERCSRHSPEKIFVRDPPPGPIEVIIRGKRWWNCWIPIEFENPSDGMVKSFRNYVFEIAWPKILVRSSIPMREDVFKSALCPSSIRAEARPGIQAPAMPVVKEADGSWVCGTCHPRPGPDSAWCGCPREPAEGPSEGLGPLIESFSVECHGDERGCTVSDLKKITVYFGFPIEEPFEVTFFNPK